VHHALDATVVFSPRSAMALRDCIIRAGLADACRNIAAVCISTASAVALEPLVFRKVIVAERPNQAAMLDAVERAAAAPKA
jgi:uroporphyrinogen-III synthase